ncbi:hypothetical protein KOR42_12190 [Thalassoglobus neptunius]|uniref:Translational regulator CsrA n=1 Tax=Thalassoglobus neptunius TaxID=1938619 RepID=A0A5C5X752_9PLAN|nr:carbon storage regulator [Thalassoglobus neptunius]TWT57852.1 hypothetical protein KOR42_12190 [Thalassoglobus neptunius]
MLVLTRKKGEEIHIGDEIVIKVSELSGNRVKLCIDAPEVMRILRGEVAERMNAQADAVSSDQTSGKSSARFVSAS